LEVATISLLIPTRDFAAHHVERKTKRRYGKEETAKETQRLTLTNYVASTHIILLGAFDHEDYWSLPLKPSQIAVLPPRSSLERPLVLQEKNLYLLAKL